MMFPTRGSGRNRIPGLRFLVLTKARELSVLEVLQLQLHVAVSIAIPA
jgi:hypothetical protein